MSEQTSPLHHDPADIALPRSTPSSASARRVDRRRRNVLTIVVTGAVLAFGAYLRFSHNNWDRSGTASGAHKHLHPDERFLTSIANDTKAPDGLLDYFDTDNSPLNPYNIQTGDGRSQRSSTARATLPDEVHRDALQWFTLGFVDEDQTNFDHYNLVGRRLAAFFDVATMLLIFFMGWRLANRPVGLIAAFLYAFAAFPIQNAHFFIVDPFMTFFATLAVFFSIRAAQSGGYRNLAIAGLAAGLAMACKTRRWRCCRWYCLLPACSRGRRSSRT